MSSPPASDVVLTVGTEFRADLGLAQPAIGHVAVCGVVDGERGHPRRVQRSPGASVLTRRPLAARQDAGRLRLGRLRRDLHHRVSGEQGEGLSAGEPVSAVTRPALRELEVLDVLAVGLGERGAGTGLVGVVEAVDHQPLTEPHDVRAGRVDEVGGRVHLVGGRRRRRGFIEELRLTVGFVVVRRELAVVQMVAGDVACRAGLPDTLTRRDLLPRQTPTRTTGGRRCGRSRPS